MEFGKSSWRTFDQGIGKEWLLTNGIGGFASSTIIGANTRRYHGLLVASLNPPVARHLILSKIDESISVGDKIYDLYSNQTPDSTTHGFLHQHKFQMDPLPTYTYNILDTFIEKKIGMIHGKNTVVVVYKVINGASRSILKLAPLINFRDYHFNSSRQHMFFEQAPYEGGVSVRPYHMDLSIKVYCNGGRFIQQQDCWFYNMDYAVERERGLHSTEDHYIPGFFEIEVSPWEEKTITVISTIEDGIQDTDGQVLLKTEEQRILQVVDKAGYTDDFARMLVRAADDFIVYRKSTGTKTIIAGYPWFTDWGRDTMIAFTGITLSTKRFDDAKEILYTFSKYVKDGLVPNVFPDAGQEPAYNSVDASMWYFEAVYKYIQYTGDYEFVREFIYPVLKDILRSYRMGTRFHIKMDNDHLIAAGDTGIQLTWMDAKIGDWVVTPRHGKAVEINALWYNALNIMALLAVKFGEDDSHYNEMADKVKNSFEQKFWNEQKQCLYDVISDQEKDGKLRPNQILAVSLSFPVLNGEKAKKVVHRVMEFLYTAYGLRSLSSGEKEYVGVYIGDQYRRDSAYHQGTVWAWPLGPFITAYGRVFGDSGNRREMARKLIEPLKDHLKDGCVGSIAEIFDGDEPHIPRGCFAQAWSVGEILRAYTEDIGGLET